MFQETIFAQLMSQVDHDEFKRCVKRYQGEKGVRSFNCNDQFKCMIFSQLAKKKSLRDTVFTLSSMNYKLYHMGIRGTVNKDNLARANEKKDYRIFEDYAQSLIQRARDLYVDEVIDLELKENIYIIDSTTVDLCLSIYDWAKFRKKKGGIKLHTIMDLKGSIPILIDITEALTADNRLIEKIELEKDAIYVMNRGYCDFDQFHRINEEGAYFITRLKRNIVFRRIYSNKADKEKGVIFDQIGRLDSRKARIQYPNKVRVVKFYDPEHEIIYSFLTNNFQLSPNTVAKLYKERWKIELFFKWIKQNLHIESFFGRSENAVKLQIWVAICAYLLVAISKKTLNIKAEMSQILHFLSNVLFEQIPIQRLFPIPDYKTNDSVSLQVPLLLDY